jgi:hypothetical protein
MQASISFLLISAIFVVLMEIMPEKKNNASKVSPFPRVLETKTKYFSILWPKGTVLTTTYDAHNKKHILVGLSSPYPITFHDLEIKTLDVIKEGYRVKTTQAYVLSGWHCEAGSVLIDKESKLQECTLQTPGMLGHIEIRDKSHVLVSTHAYYARHRAQKAQKDTWVLTMDSVRLKGVHLKSLGLMYAKDKINVLYAFKRSPKETKETLKNMLKRSKQ